MVHYLLWSPPSKKAHGYIFFYYAIEAQLAQQQQLVISNSRSVLQEQLLAPNARGIL
jgi:hypothetical protein